MNIDEYLWYLFADFETNIPANKNGIFRKTNKESFLSVGFKLCESDSHVFPVNHQKIKIIFHTSHVQIFPKLYITNKKLLCVKIIQKLKYQIMHNKFYEFC